MKAGKLSPEKLRGLVFAKLQQRRSDILLRPGLGEDSAVIDFGDEVCVISTDPITGAEHRLGWLAVHVACNDVAASGAEPVGVQVALLLPEDTTDALIAEIMTDIDSACAQLGIEIIGGHTEITSQVERPLIVTTAIGRASRHRYVTSAGSSPGDIIYVTRGVGYEGTAILAIDFASLLRDRVDVAVLERAQTFLDHISVVPEALAAAAAGATAMHDITEGGFYGALWEISMAGGPGYSVRVADVPVLPETRAICAALHLDPLGLISSGSLLITAPPDVALIDAVRAVGGTATAVGEVVEGKRELWLPDGSRRELDAPVEDELWRFLAGR